MSVIGGYFGGARGRCDGVALTEISRSMVDCGGRREAFIKGSVGLSVGLDDGENVGAGLYFLENGSGLYASVISGELCGRGGEELLLKYSDGDIEHECPAGCFSAAVSREGEELYLIRGGEGSPSLYYAVCGSDIAFASRIWGLIGFIGGCFVSEDDLRAHLTASAGSFYGEDLYRGIYKIGTNSGLKLDHTGVSSVLFDPRDISQANVNGGDWVSEFICPEGDELRGILMEILMAFDYPQFDAFMPTFIRDVLSAGTVIDDSLCTDTRYSLERRACLFSLCGKCPQIVPPLSQRFGTAELSQMDEALRTILGEDDCGVYTQLLGKDWRSLLEKEKNAARRIRMSGMLWQTAFWYEKYNISLI